MLLKEKQALMVFRRVRDFLKEKAPDVGYGSVEGVVAQLNDAIANLETHAREQDARQRITTEATQQQRAQVKALRREFMTPVSRGARMLFPENPTLLQAFAMPDARDYMGTVAAAEAMAQVATQHASKFRIIGLPEDFVKRMQDAVAQLRAQLDLRAADVGLRSAATAGLRREYLRGRELVRMLDAMVAPRLTATPPRFAEWRSLSRFLRVNVAITTDPERPGATTPSSPAVPPPAPSGEPGTPEARAA